MGDSRDGDSTGDTIHLTGVSTQIRSSNEVHAIPMTGVRVQRDVDIL